MRIIQYAEEHHTVTTYLSQFASMPGNGFSLNSAGTLTSGLNFAAYDYRYKHSTTGVVTVDSQLGIWEFDTGYSFQIHARNYTVMWEPSTAESGSGHPHYQMDTQSGEVYNAAIKHRFITYDFDLSSLGYASAISLYNNNYTLGNYYANIIPSWNANDYMDTNTNPDTVVSAFIHRAKTWITATTNAVIHLDYASFQGFRATTFGNISAGTLQIPTVYGIFFIGDWGTGTTGVRFRNYGGVSPFPNTTYYFFAKRP